MQAISDRAALLAWYDANKRDTPWRRTREPYAVWVSEVMLQQTQVATALPYYERWMARLPSLRCLAGATEQEVLSLWQGLGYYRRARMLLEGARWVIDNGMPQSSAEWRKVPGVGPYTAAAIASICFGEASAVVDGNVERVFARFTGCALSGAQLHRAAWEWAPRQITEERPGDWNQAMMELGAVVCRPREPLCDQCPLAAECVAKAKSLQKELPKRAPKKSPKEIRQTAVVAIHEGRFGLEQIPAGEWWEGMWRFPLGVREALRALDSPRSGVVRHTVTNHKVTLEVHTYEGKIEGLSWYTLEELKHLPMPAPQRKALKLAIECLHSPAVDA